MTRKDGCSGNSTALEDPRDCTGTTQMLSLCREASLMPTKCAVEELEMCAGPTIRYKEFVGLVSVYVNVLMYFVYFYFA